MLIAAVVGCMVFGAESRTRARAVLDKHQDSIGSCARYKDVIGSCARYTVYTKKKINVAEDDREQLVHDRHAYAGRG